MRVEPLFILLPFRSMNELLIDIITKYCDTICSIDMDLRRNIIEQRTVRIPCMHEGNDIKGGN